MAAATSAAAPLAAATADRSPYDSLRAVDARTANMLSRGEAKGATCCMSTLLAGSDNSESSDCRVHCLRALSSQPVIHLDLENVRRPVAEQRGAVAREVEVSYVVRPGACLRPDEEHRRAGAVFPTQDRVADERAIRKVRIAERERLRRAGTVRIDGIGRSRRRARGCPDNGTGVLPVNDLLDRARRGKFAERRIITAGEVRLRVQLQCKIRRKRPVDACIERPGLGPEVGKYVAVTVECCRGRVVLGRDVLRVVLTRAERRRETYEDARCRLERDPGRDGQLMSARADAGTALHGHIEYCACAGIGRDLTHHDLVAATHHYRPTAGQTIIEHC